MVSMATHTPLHCGLLPVSVSFAIHHKWVWLISNYDVILSPRWSSLLDPTGGEMSLCSGLVSIVVTDKNMLTGVYKLGKPHPLPHAFILRSLNLSIILFSNL